MGKIEIKEEERPEKRFIKIGATFLFGLILLTMLISSIVNVPAGSVGILFNRMGGGVDMTPMGEGWHFQVPFVQTIYIMSVQTQKTEYPASAASKDLQIVNSHVAVSYHVIPSEAPKVYQTVGGDFSDKLIAPAIQEKFKASTAMFNAEDLIQQRETVKSEVTNALQTLLTKYGIKVDEVSIVNFDFSPEFNNAIEQKVVAQQQQLTASNVLVIKQIEAQQKIAEASGIANSTVLRAQAEAEALRLQRLQVNDEMIRLRMIDKWNGVLPQFMMGGESPLLMVNPDTMMNRSS